MSTKDRQRTQREIDFQKIADEMHAGRITYAKGKRALCRLFGVSPGDAELLPDHAGLARGIAIKKK